jgi:hypothetical protein
MAPFAPLVGRGAAVAAGLASFGALLIFFSSASSREVAVTADNAPLFSPDVYTSVGGLVALIVGLCAAGAYAYRDKWNDKASLTWLLPAGVMLLVLFVRLSALPGAIVPRATRESPTIGRCPQVCCWAGWWCSVLGLTIPRGVFFVLPVVAVQTSSL